MEEEIFSVREGEGERGELSGARGRGEERERVVEEGGERAEAEAG